MNKVCASQLRPMMWIAPVESGFARDVKLTIGKAANARREAESQEMASPSTWSVNHGYACSISRFASQIRVKQLIENVGCDANGRVGDLNMERCVSVQICA